MIADVSRDSNHKGAALSQLLDILKAEGRAITEEFNLASKQGEGTPQEVADFRENAVQSFIARFYPQNFVVSKGKITDLDGAQSDSIDCLLLNPAHPHLVDSKGKFRLIFAETNNLGSDHAKWLIKCEKRSKKGCFFGLNTPFGVQNCRSKDYF